ncbi:probable WRKY transcription factor 30 [Salvia miltiorrhiza]|uniref:probable WRKY transcription factor 30 n=1 Tax=Salvia miltiorrhiza TaxID=226208 RepID=UPI0025ABE143|nr:probable WRKY transcription factor 30 [Salvia miltiorrhiza]
MSSPPFSGKGMENFPSDSDLKNLVRELSQGKEMAKQLQNHLNLHSSSSRESREFLLHRIMYSYDQALSMLTHNDPAAAAASQAPLPPPESPRPVAGSPQSDDSDQDFTDQTSRKRKASDRWSQKVKVGPEVGVEGQLDDGYGWRKYGQKEILGAKHPRGYYRCTYRHAHGCLATKQVQRSDEDPTIFEITYRRKHTCNRATNNPPVPDPRGQDPNPLTQNPQSEPPFNIQTTLNPPFNFSSSSPINPQNDNIFSDRNNALGNYYPNPTNDLNADYGELIPNLRHSDSELSPIVAAMTNSATLDADFPFGPSGFGSVFDFDNSGHYP